MELANRVTEIAVPNHTVFQLLSRGAPKDHYIRVIKKLYLGM